MHIYWTAGESDGKNAVKYLLCRNDWEFAQMNWSIAFNKRIIDSVLNRLINKSIVETRKK